MSTLHCKGGYLIFIVWSMFVHIQTHEASASLSDHKGSAMGQLIKDLLKDYDPHVEPSMGLTNVSISLAILTIDYNSDTEQLTTRAWEILKWTDTRLSWSRKEYPGIKSIRLPTDMLWKPDIELYNSIKKTDRDDVLAVITDDGFVSYTAPVTYHTLCLHYGQPIITCHLKLGSWTYDGTRIGIYTDNAVSPDMSDFYGRFDVINATANVYTLKYECCPEPYMDYTSKIAFRVQP